MDLNTILLVIAVTLIAASFIIAQFLIPRKK